MHVLGEYWSEENSPPRWRGSAISPHQHASIAHGITICNTIPSPLCAIAHYGSFASFFSSNGSSFL